MLILAGNKLQFMDWIIYFGLTRSEFIYIWDYQSIAGRKNCKMRLIGTYWENKDYEKIIDYCATHNIERF